MDYEKLMIDPCAAHKEMVREDGYYELRSFVRGMAMMYKIRLAVLPTWDKEVNKWKMVAKLMSNNVVEGMNNDHSEDIEEPFVNMSKYRAHFRSAHLYLNRAGIQVIREGCLVNKHLLDKNELRGFQILVNEYNNRIREIYKDTHEFISIKEWMESRGALITEEV